MLNTDNHIISFSKYHGAGNDFVMINAFRQDVELSQKQVFQMCNRRIGIGADGLIILMPSENFDFKMKYYNCDGSESTFCGNGGRCITAFALQQEIIRGSAVFESIDGIHHAEVKQLSENEFHVELSMKDISTYEIDSERLLIDTGSPHFVKRVDNLDDFDVKAAGAAIRYDKSISSEGVNVDFMTCKDQIYRIRTYERGVEDETLACGTGVTASAIAASLWYGGKNIDILTSIAKLNVKFEREGDKFKNIILSGPATRVFDGIYIFADDNN